MDLRTFLPPATVSMGRPPGKGDAAPALADEPLRGPAVVAFLRHAGCPFAETTFTRLREVAAAEPAAQCVAVSHAAGEATERWVEEIGGPGEVRVVSDPDRRLYAAWGVGRTSLGHFAGRRSMGAVVRLARDGVRNRHPTGSRWQSAGTFAVDASGIVTWRHLPDHAGDLPDLRAALAATGASSAV